LLNKAEELLIITMEECGELTQACSKMIRTQGRDEKYRKKLVEEIGDVALMIELLKVNDFISQEDINERMKVKKKKLKKWSNLFE
jgi:NTP pyrophosphatase (non-canonical NTP hydrolase)